jgi:glucose dehydrogenase
MKLLNRPMQIGALVAGSLALASVGGAQDLTTLSSNQNNWVMTGRTYDLQRFSPLTQISTANVAHLHPVWSFSTGTLRGHEGNPLVIGNIMYVQSSFPNKVYALDLSKDGAPQVWQYTPEQDAATIPVACCDVVNRGVAWHPPTADHSAGIIYIELLQGDLLALDAKTGKKVYQVKSADFKTGSTMTNCPLVV